MRVPGLGDDKPVTPVGTTADGRPIVTDTVTPATTPPPAAASTDAAYVQGAKDARKADAEAEKRAREIALERERAQERTRRRRGFPLLTLIVVILALIGAAFIYLSIRNGSTKEGGAAIGNTVSDVTAPARDAAADVKDRAGAAVERTGEALKNSGEKLRK